MKKILAMLLALCLTFGLVACGGTSTPTEPQNEAVKVELIVLRYNDTARGYEEMKVEVTLIEYVPIEPQS